VTEQGCVLCDVGDLTFYTILMIGFNGLNTRLKLRVSFMHSFLPPVFRSYYIISTRPHCGLLGRVFLYLPRKTKRKVHRHVHHNSGRAQDSGLGIGRTAQRSVSGRMVQTIAIKRHTQHLELPSAIFHQKKKLFAAAFILWTHHLCKH
jgi:hypothetical protein